MARNLTETINSIIENVEKVIIGKRRAVQLTLVSFLCEGHVLLEDVPGVAKTMLARALARSIGCSFNRIQCTPDLLPTDVTGTSVFNQKTTEFEFRPGPILSQIVLADEINRATPRAQSALLEAMAEGQVTVDGVTHKLPRPFVLIATQNPVEHEGTFPLPEAQLDRFLIRLSIGYPAFEHEDLMLQRLQEKHPIEGLQQVATAEDLAAAQEQVRQVFVHEKIREYILNLVHATRKDENFTLGGSPRASLCLFHTSQALATMENRNYVLPDDVKRLFLPVLEHRVILRPDSRLRRVTAADVLKQILEMTAAPVHKG